MTRGGATPDRFEAISAELEHIAEQLADLAMDILREGLADGGDEAAATATTREKLVNRARSSVAKAKSLLDRAADDSGFSVARRGGEDAFDS